MKKLLAVLSSVALLLTMLTVMMTTVYAAAPITYTVGTVQHTGAIAQDEELTVTVSSSELASFYGAALTVNYDSTQLEVVSAEAAGWLSNVMFGSPVDTSTAGQIVVNATSMFQAYSSAADEVFLTITFKALADIEADVALTLTDATVTQEFSMMPGQTAAEAADVVDGGFVIADDSTTTDTQPSDTTTYVDTTTETAEPTDTTAEVTETTTEIVTSSTGETTDTTTTAVMTYMVQTVEHSGAVATDEEIWIDVYGSEISSFYRTAFTVTYDDTQFELLSYTADGFLAEVTNATINTDTAGEIAVSINNNRNALSCTADEVVLTLSFKALADIEDDAVIGLKDATVSLDRRPDATAYDAAMIDGGVTILPIITGTSVTVTTDTTGESTTTDTMPDTSAVIESTTAVTTIETTAVETTVATATEVTTTVETTVATSTEAATTATETETTATVTESTTETTESQTTTSATVTTAEGTEVLFTVATVECALSQLSVGTLIEVPLSATALDSFSEMSMTVSYDSDKLQYVAFSKATDDTWFTNGDVTEETAGQLTLEVSSGFGPFGGSLTANGGVFATLIFRVSAELSTGDILALTATDPYVSVGWGNGIVADCISGAIVVAPETTTSAEDTTTGTTSPTEGSTTASTVNTTTTPTTAPTETSTSTDSTTESTTSTTESTSSTESTETTESTTVTDPATTTTTEPTTTTTIETTAATESTTVTDPTETTGATETTSTTESTTAPTEAAPEKGNGDTDGNGAVNIRDAVQCYYHVNGKIILDAESQARADVGAPYGRLTIQDAVAIYYFVNGKTSSL